MIAVCLLAHPGVARRARRCLRNRGQKPMVKAVDGRRRRGGRREQRSRERGRGKRPAAVEPRDGAAAMELQITTEIAVPPEGAGV